MLEWDILNYLKKWRTNLRATLLKEEKENGDYSWYQKYSQYVSGYYSWHSD